MSETVDQDVLELALALNIAVNSTAPYALGTKFNGNGSVLLEAIEVAQKNS